MANDDKQQKAPSFTPSQPDQYIRLPNGEYGRFSGNATDDEIRDQIEQAFPGTYATPRTPIPTPAPTVGPARTIGPTASLPVRAARETVMALPAIGATIGGIAGAPLSPAGQVGLAALMGGGGEAARQLIARSLGWSAPKTSEEAALEITKAGGEQGIWEMLGQYFKPFRLGRVAGETVTAEDLLKMSRTPGFKMSASEVRGTPPSLAERYSGLGLLSREALEGYEQKTVQGAEKLATEMLNDIAPAGTPQALGQNVQNALKTAFAAFKREGEVHYGPFRGTFGEQIPTDFDPLVKLAKDIEKQRTRLLQVPAGPFIVTAPLPQQSPAGLVLNVLKSLKGQPQNFKTALEVRDFLSQFMPGTDQLFADREAESIAKRAWKKLGDQLTADALAFDRSNASRGLTTFASPRWEAAKTFWQEGRQRFESTYYRGLMRKNPEFVAKSLRPGDVSDVQLLKNILTGYGTPQEKQAGQEAWNDFQRTFAEQRFFGDPGGKAFTLDDLKDMKGRMDTLGGPMLREIYHDPAGQEFLRRARAFAELMDRTKFQAGLRTGQWSVMYDIIGMTGLGASIATRAPGEVIGTIAAVQGLPRVLTAIFHSRTATNLFLRAIMAPPANKAAIAARIVSETVKGLQRSAPETYGRGTPLGEPELKVEGVPAP